MPRVRLTSAAFAAFASLSLLTVPAEADQATETFIRDWIASIDASPDWAASYASLASEAGSDRTTLYGLAVRSERPGFTLNFDSIVVGGFAPATDGTFAAKDLFLDGGRIAGGFVTMEVANAEFSDFSLPPAAAFTLNDPRPFVALIKALTPITKVKIASGRIGSVVLTEDLEGVTSRVSYGEIAIDNWSDGKIASISAGPITTASPAEEPLTEVSVAAAETRDIDLNAMFAVFDPDRYLGGVGDRVWRPMIGRASYRDMIAAAPGVSIRVAEAAVENFRLRQPKDGIGPLLELGLSPASDTNFDDPAEALKLFGLLSAYGIGNFTMRDLDIRAVGVDAMRLGRLTLADLSSDRIGELSIDGFETAVGGQGSVVIGRIALGGLVPPALEAIIAAAKASDDGRDVDVTSVLPTLAFVEAAGIDVNLEEQPRATLERFRLDLGNYVGAVPTSIALDLADIDMAVEVIEDRKSRRMLQDLGYERVRIDATLKMEWSETGEIAVNEFKLAMKDVGALSGDATLSGLLPSEVDQLDDPAVVEKLSIVRGSLTFTDESIVGRSLGAQATKLKADPQKFRDQFAMGLPFMLTFLGDMDLQKQLAPVLQAFVKTTGGSITAVAGPTLPVPLSLVSAAAETAPFTLLKMLQVTFSGVPGTDAPVVVPKPVNPTPAEAGKGKAMEDSSKLRPSVEP